MKRTKDYLEEMNPYIWDELEQEMFRYFAEQEERYAEEALRHSNGRMYDEQD